MTPWRRAATYGRQASNACVLHGDDEWGGGGIFIFQIEARIIGWNKETDDHGASDVEHQDAEVDTLDGLGQITSWVLRFPGSDLLA